MPPLNELKGRKFCKFHQMTGHTANNCVHFRELIQKAIKEGRLTFNAKDGKMKVDIDPFEVSSNFAEPALILANIAEIKINHIDNPGRLQWTDEVERDYSESIKQPIFLTSGESLFDFLSR